MGIQDYLIPYKEAFSTLQIQWEDLPVEYRTLTSEYHVARIGNAYLMSIERLIEVNKIFGSFDRIIFAGNEKFGTFCYWLRGNYIEVWEVESGDIKNHDAAIKSDTFRDWAIWSLDDAMYDF